MITLDLESLRKQFGEDLADGLHQDIEFGRKESLEYKIEIIDKNEFFTTIAFATESYAHIYEVENNGKWMNERRISLIIGEKVLELMESLRDEKKSI